MTAVPPPGGRFGFGGFSSYANDPTPRRADPARLQRLAGSTMGTHWSLLFDNPAMLPLEAVRRTIDAALDRVIAQMSTWELASDISRYAAAPAGSRHPLTPQFATVLACALRWAEASGGAIDPTIGPLVAAWGFGANAARGAGVAVVPPTDAERVDAQARTGWQRLDFRPDEATVLQPGGFELDLSGVAKGFAVDHVTQALLALGLGHLLIEIGGELRGVGQRPGGSAWQVRIDGAAGVLNLSDMAVATSGTRWQVRRHGERCWSHTIDPRSGKPTAPALSSVTVLHPSCMDADALATVLMVLGPVQGMAFAETHRVAAHFLQDGVPDAPGSLPGVSVSTGWSAGPVRS